MRTRVLVISLVLTLGATAMQAQTTSKSKTMSVCKDGTTSTVIGAGACSGHGGVDDVATAAAQKSAKAAKARKKADKAKLKNNPQKAAAAEAKAEKAESKLLKADEKAAKDATGATAQCKDGTYSHAASTQGACARHGGVAKVLKP